MEIGAEVLCAFRGRQRCKKRPFLRSCTASEGKSQTNVKHTGLTASSQLKEVLCVGKISSLALFFLLKQPSASHVLPASQAVSSTLHTCCLLVSSFSTSLSLISDRPCQLFCWCFLLCFYLSFLRGFISAC